LFCAAENSLDDLMHVVFSKLLKGQGKHRVKDASKGPNTEVFGALFELKNPRARLSRSQSRSKAFSALGEFLWYVSGSNKIAFIEHYLPGYSKFSNDGETANGAYGPRLFGMDAVARQLGASEWDRVIRTLRTREGSRNAVIQVFANSDATPENEDKPCTCTLQFAIRNNRLVLHVHMRSNDVIKGLPHDVFSFTTLQEIAARELDKELGSYYHSVASLHLYDDKEDDKPRSQAERYLAEGLHEHVPMPAMPKGNPWDSLNRVIEAEAQIRGAKDDGGSIEGLNPYWMDFVWLLRIHREFKSLDTRSAPIAERYAVLRPIAEMMKELSSDVYKLYVQDRLNRQVEPIGDLFEHKGRTVDG